MTFIMNRVHNAKRRQCTERYRRADQKKDHPGLLSDVGFVENRVVLTKFAGADVGFGNTLTRSSLAWVSHIRLADSGVP